MIHDAQFSGQPSHMTAIPCMQPLVQTYRLIGPFYPLMPRLKDLHLILIGKIVSRIDYFFDIIQVVKDITIWRIKMRFRSLKRGLEIDAARF